MVGVLDQRDVLYHSETLDRPNRAIKIGQGGLVCMRITAHFEDQYMAAEILEQFRISDFLNWNRQKLLVLNPDFQRRSVWTPEAHLFD